MSMAAPCAPENATRWAKALAFRATSPACLETALNVWLVGRGRRAYLVDRVDAARFVAACARDATLIPPGCRVLCLAGQAWVVNVRAVEDGTVDALAAVAAVVSGGAARDGSGNKWGAVNVDAGGDARGPSARVVVPVFVAPALGTPRLPTRTEHVAWVRALAVAAGHVRALVDAAGRPGTSPAAGPVAVSCQCPLRAVCPVATAAWLLGYPVAYDTGARTPPIEALAARTARDGAAASPCDGRCAGGGTGAGSCCCAGAPHGGVAHCLDGAALDVTTLTLRWGPPRPDAVGRASPSDRQPVAAAPVATVAFSVPSALASDAHIAAAVGAWRGAAVAWATSLGGVHAQVVTRANVAPDAVAL